MLKQRTKNCNTCKYGVMVNNGKQIYCKKNDYTDSLDAACISHQYKDTAGITPQEYANTMAKISQAQSDYDLAIRGIEDLCADLNRRLRQAREEFEAFNQIVHALENCHVES